MGTCQANGTKVSSTVPDLFEENTPLKGRKIKRKVKYNTEGCWSYEVWHKGAKVEDPELELMQF